MQMHNDPNKKQFAGFMSTKREWWLTGEHFWKNGIGTVFDIKKAIRSMGYFLFVGSPEDHLSRVLDSDDRYRAIMDVIERSNLPLSVYQRQQTEADVRVCCNWEKGKTLKGD